MYICMCRYIRVYVYSEAYRNEQVEYTWTTSIYICWSMAVECTRLYRDEGRQSRQWQWSSPETCPAISAYPHPPCVHRTDCVLPLICPPSTEASTSMYAVDNIHSSFKYIMHDYKTSTLVNQLCTDYSESFTTKQLLFFGTLARFKVNWNYD